MSMTIWAGYRDIVRFSFPNNGTDYDKKLCARLLEVGRSYSIHRTNVSDNYTDVYLRDYPTIRFNSVMFEDVDINPKNADIRKRAWYSNLRNW